MKSRTENQNETLLDFNDVFWKFVSQWKVVLLAAVMVSFAICGIIYSRDLQNYNSQKEESEALEELSRLSADEQIETVRDSLPEEDRNIVNYLINEQLWVDKQEQYLQDSLLMQTDATNQRLLTLTFNINAYNDADLPILRQCYLEFASGESTSEAIKSAMAIDVDVKYVNELFYKDEEDLQYEEADSPVLTVKIILPENTDEENIVKAMRSSLTEFCNELNARYPNSLTFDRFGISHFFNSETVSNKRTIVDGVNGMRNNIYSLKDSLSDEQKTAFDYIISVYRNKMSVDGENADDEALAEKETLIAPKPNLKYALLGFVVGILMYAITYSAMLTMNGQVNSAASIEGNLGIRLIGELYQEVDSKGLSTLFHSKSINRRYYKNKLNVDDQIKKITKRIEALTKNIQTGEVTLFSVPCKGSYEGAEKMLLNIVESISRRDISVSTIKGSDLLEGDEQRLSGSNNAVLVVEDASKVADVKKIIALCDEYNIDILGSVYVAEV